MAQYTKPDQADRYPEAYGVDAAGAVVWRAEDGRVVLVHRPYYDDWSLPKGKCDPGESYAQTAVREVEEETGITGDLGPYLTEVTYPVPAKGQPGTVMKTVVYYALHAGSLPSFEPNEEVDILAWLPIEEAQAKTSYPGDRAVLEAFKAWQTQQC